jgi:hypothetical protein
MNGIPPDQFRRLSEYEQEAHRRVLDSLRRAESDRHDDADLAKAVDCAADKAKWQYSSRHRLWVLVKKAALRVAVSRERPIQPVDPANTNWTFLLAGRGDTVTG